MPSYRKFDIFSNATAQYFNSLRKGNRHWSEYFNLHHQVTMYRWGGFAVLIGRLRWQVAYGIWRYNQSVSTMKYSKELITIGFYVFSAFQFRSSWLLELLGFEGWRKPEKERQKKPPSSRKKTHNIEILVWKQGFLHCATLLWRANSIWGELNVRTMKACVEAWLMLAMALVVGRDLCYWSALQVLVCYIN